MKLQATAILNIFLLAAKIAQNPAEPQPRTEPRLDSVEVATKSKTFTRIVKTLLIFALCVSCCAISGCLESSFQLANKSRLPKWISLPPGLTRTDVSVTLNYYTNPLGSDAKLILKDRKGKKLTQINGKLKNLYPLELKNPPPGFDRGYPIYEIVVANGMTEIMEHRKMEPIFYVTDDPAILKELLPGGAGLAQENSGPGYWVDPATGLMWAAKDNGKDVSWSKAMKYCRDLRLAGYSDWRLANMAELQGIYDKSAESPGLAGPPKEPRAFTWHVKGNLFLTGDEWSSPQIPDDRGLPSGYAFRWDFNEGRAFEGDEVSFSTNKRALCVRGSD